MAVLWSYAYRLVSIHAPARGATSESHISNRSGHHSRFNPRSREGSDNHAANVSQFIQNLPCFNPRSREGSDGKSGKADAEMPCPRVSIHAPARGATVRRKVTFNAPVRLFQSTLPRGERRIRCRPSRSGGHVVSIHAPARGATHCRREAIH